MKAWKTYYSAIGRGFSEIISRVAEVERSIDSADSWVDEKGHKWASRAHTAPFYDTSQGEEIADLSIALVRAVGFRFGLKFRLEKQVILPNGDRDIFTRQIYPSRASRWKLKCDVLELKPKRRPGKDFPERVKYLAVVADRCYGVGGKSVCFRKSSDLQAFLDRLPSHDRREFVEIYKSIVKRKDNEWYLKWARARDENLDFPDWSNKVEWLFMFLDRLREGGLMSQVRGKAKRTVLKYWDDYLCGKPYEDDYETPETGRSR